MLNPSRKNATLLNWLNLDREATEALYKQIGNQIRGAILSGALEPGVVLPATRVLARDLSVARITASRAYEQLDAEGFLETRRGSGTWVSPSLSRQKMARLAESGKLPEPPIDHTLKHVLNLYDDEPTDLAFQPGIPAYDAFPRSLWARLIARQAARIETSLLDYAHVGGYAPLRVEIAKYLGGSRGLRCEPEQVIVTTSVRAAIAAAGTLLWRPGALVAVEDPGYGVARRVLKGRGFRPFPVPVDDHGLRVDDLLASGSPCAGAYLTPAHHWPTGVALAADRRVDLLDWTVRSGAWIIEDDYDSEFRFESPPLGTLHALGSGRVIYVGTFSKTFAPSLRTAYMVVPRELVLRFERQVFESATEPSLHVQAALSELLAEGHFTRHIARMRKLYARRRVHLIDAMHRVFGRRIEIICPPGGLQILAKFPRHVSSTEISRRAAAANLHVRDLNQNYVIQLPENLVQLGFAAVPEPDIDPAVRRLGRAVADLI